jgi:hypothetical protein
MTEQEEQIRRLLDECARLRQENAELGAALFPCFRGAF